MIEWIKKNGLASIIIAGMLGLYGFFIENRTERRYHEEDHVEIKGDIDEIKNDVKNMPKRILDEVRAREHLRKMQEEGIERDTTTMTININR